MGIYKSMSLYVDSNFIEDYIKFEYAIIVTFIVFTVSTLYAPCSKIFSSKPA